MVLDVYKMLFSVNAKRKIEFFMILILQNTLIILVTFLSTIIGVDHSPNYEKKLHAIAFNYYQRITTK